MAEAKKKASFCFFRKEIWGPSLLMGVGFSWMIGMFEPMQLYFTNIGEYWFDLYNLLPACLIIFGALLTGSLIYFLLASLPGRKVWDIAFILYGIVFLCTYIQGNYLSGKLPLLDGNAVPWGDYDYQRKYTILLWATVILLTAILFWKKKREAAVKAYVFIAALILGICLITGLTTGITKQGWTDKGDLTLTTDGLLTMSSEGQNFIILLVDSVNGEEMNDWLEKDEAFRTELKDFTYYSDTMAAYPLTYYALYFMLSGDWYEGDEIINDYRTNIFLHSPLFDKLEDGGYTLGMYTQDLPYIENNGFYRFRNLKKAETYIASYFKFVKLELRMVGLRYAPYDLKKRCLAYPNEFTELKAAKGIDDELYRMENDFFLAHVAQGVTTTKDSQFKLIHIDGAHAPNFVNRNLERQETETSYYESVGGAMATAIEYLHALKAAGVYDNSIIVLLSDHGFNSTPLEGYSYNPYDRQHSVLYVKGLGEQHETLAINNAPISHADLMDAYDLLLAGNGGGEVFPYKEGDKRERRYLWYIEPEKLRLEEYLQTGYAGDEETLRPTGRVYMWPQGLLTEE